MARMGRAKKLRESSPLEMINVEGEGVGVRPRPSYPRWRACSLSLVYLLFVIHIVHWKLTGKTLAPLELNEVMYTLELGIITAGFLFMGLLVLGTLLFGRFFCSWACHIMVLQELCAWLLSKIGIRAKPVRSRLMLWIPPLTAFYMFLWPQIIRAWEMRALPTFHFATDRTGWASFVTNNFWRNLPGPWVIALTFVVCGFLIVYVLGSRTFCTYVCPYGAIFEWADRIAPGRIRVTEDCQQCGRCTAACTSGVRVHEEVHRHGMIVNPACLKCLDCVSVCPQRALRYRFGKPSLLRSYESGGRFGRRYDLNWVEEWVAAAVFIVVLLSFRGLYSRVPFLLSLAMGVVLGFTAVLTLRLFTRRQVRLSTACLKNGAGLTWKGRWFAGCMVVLATFIGHSAFVRYHEYNGLRQAAALDQAAYLRGIRGGQAQEPDLTATAREDAGRYVKASANADTGRNNVGLAHRSPSRNEPLVVATAAEVAFQHLQTADQWGLIDNERVERAAAGVAYRLDRFEQVERYARRFLRRHPGEAAVRLTLAKALAKSRRAEEAEREFRTTLSYFDNGGPDQGDQRAMALAGLGGVLMSRGDYATAVSELSQAVQFDPHSAAIHADLGGALAEVGRFEEAVEHLSQAVHLDPALPGAAYNLGSLFLHMGRYEDALPHLSQALQLTTDDPDAHNNLGITLLELGRVSEALIPLHRAVAINATHADAHFNLARALAHFNDWAGAEQHLNRAVQLDPRYAQWLEKK